MAGFETALVSLDAKTAERTRTCNRRDPGEYFFMLVQDFGQCAVHQNAVATLLNPGDMFIVDATQPSKFVYDINWSIGTQPDAGLVNTMLDAAVETVSEGEERPIVHSDRGGHYRWSCWLTRISEAKLVRSMSRTGYSQDNAACEGFFGRLKTELFYPRDWKTIKIERFVDEVDAYIRWYNEMGIKISLGSLSPVEYRKSLGLTV